MTERIHFHRLEEARDENQSGTEPSPLTRPACRLLRLDPFQMGARSSQPRGPSFPPGEPESLERGMLPRIGRAIAPCPRESRRQTRDRASPRQTLSPPRGPRIAWLG